MKDWQAIQERVAIWRATELKKKGVTLEGTLEHLQEEVKDLVKNPYDPLALADVFILLMGVCDEVGFTMDEVLVAVESKQAINESRLWGDADDKGVIRHIEETKF